MAKYIEAFVSNSSIADRRDPAISPLYANLGKWRGRLPPALFTCGTEDPLLDDSVFMSAKWQMAGAEAVLRVYEGAPHGFISFPRQHLEAAGQGLDVTKEFMLEKMG